MDHFAFGPRDGAIVQMAYSVADIQAEMRRYSELLHVGPWFLVGPFVPPESFYRGQKTIMQVSLAYAYSGELMIELIQQHDDQPSVFQETRKAHGDWGFHHFAIGARDFDKAAADYRGRGYAEAYYGIRPEPLNCRCLYFDATRDLPGMLEVIEVNQATEEFYRRMYQAAKEWNGKDHIVHRI
jgi:hypothetical protein